MLNYWNKITVSEISLTIFQTLKQQTLADLRLIFPPIAKKQIRYAKSTYTALIRKNFKIINHRLIYPGTLY